jgi:hypothetical protein
MTYKKNFVVAIKVNGKILRESAEEVQLPFGSEYSILLKNLNPVRAMAQISIDGKDATTWLILPANGTVEVERFLRADNLKQGNRFKFVERTEQVEAHRGIQLEDGLVRVEFKKEKVFEAPKVVEHHTYHHHYDYDGPHHPWYPYRPYWYNTNYCGTLASSSSGGSTGVTRSLGMLNKSLPNVQAQNMMLSAQCMKSADENTAGITAPGSLSNQEFINASGFQTEASEVITLKLTGHKGPLKVQKPLTVDIRAVCQTCGKRAKGSAKFCYGCGTSLQII